MQLADHFYLICKFPFRSSQPCQVSILNPGSQCGYRVYSVHYIQIIAYLYIFYLNNLHYDKSYH